MRVGKLTESLERKYSLQEKRNPDNEDINSVIRKFFLEPLTDDEIEYLEDNGLTFDEGTLIGPNGKKIDMTQGAYHRMRGPTNPANKHKGNKKFNKNEVQKDFNRAKTLRTSDDVEDGKKIAKNYQMYGELAGTYKKSHNRQYNDSKADTDINRNDDNYDINTWTGPDYFAQLDTYNNAYNSVDYFNYLTKKDNTPVRRTDNKLGHNDNVGEYKSLASELKDANNSLELARYQHHVYNDEEIDRRHDTFRDRMNRQIKDKRYDLRQANEYNKHRREEVQSEIDNIDREIDDIFKSKGLTRRKKNESFLTERKNPNNEKINQIIRKWSRDEELSYDEIDALKSVGITDMGGYLVGSDGRRLYITNTEYNGRRMSGPTRNYTIGKSIGMPSRTVDYDWYGDRNDKTYVNAFDSVDYCNYLTKPRNKEIPRNSYKLGNNIASTDYKDLIQDKKEKQKELDERPYLSDDELESRLADYSSQALRSMRSDIDTFHRANDENTEILKQKEDIVRQKEKALDDFLQSKGIRRRNK